MDDMNRWELFTDEELAVLIAAYSAAASEGAADEDAALRVEMLDEGIRRSLTVMLYGHPIDLPSYRAEALEGGDDMKPDDAREASDSYGTVLPCGPNTWEKLALAASQVLLGWTRPDHVPKGTDMTEIERTENGIVLKGRIKARLTILDEKGSAIAELPMRNLNPGDTISWTYPDDGVELELT